MSAVSSGSVTLTRAVIAAGAMLVLAAVNYAIYSKERVIREGELVFLELAPVDPRSLMQGDYMALRFAIAGGIDPARSERAVPVELDERRVATRAEPDASAPLLIRYRVRNGQIWLGTNAYFFEEGTAPRYTGARFGEFRVDRRSGEAVLVGLRNDALERL
jgi:uncharacterized membrane-anchored protein